MGQMKSWKPQVQTAGNGDAWSENNLAFRTEAEALASARNLMARWMLVTDCRAAPSEQEPNYQYDELTGALVTIPGA